MRTGCTNNFATHSSNILTWNLPNLDSFCAQCNFSESQDGHNGHGPTSALDDLEQARQLSPTAHTVFVYCTWTVVPLISTVAIDTGSKGATSDWSKQNEKTRRRWYNERKRKTMTHRKHGCYTYYWQENRFRKRFLSWPGWFKVT